MSNYIIREATVDDVDFIVEAIIEAEKSASDVFSYSNILSSYLVAEVANKVVGTVGAWVEHEETSSSIIKSNLLSYFLPKSSILYASTEAKITSELIIEHIKEALSLAVVYISPEHRGMNLFELLTNEHIDRNAGVNELAIQVMSNNYYAIRSYERYGFRKSFVIRSKNEKIKQFLSFNEKMLMKKTLKK